MKYTQSHILLTFSILFSLALSLDTNYQIQKIVNLNQKLVYSKLEIISDEYLVVHSESEATVYSTITLKKIKTFSLLPNQQIFFTANGVISIEDGGLTTIFYSYIDQNKTFYQNNLYGDMIITQKYALIGKNNQTQPILKKLTLDTLELTDVTFPYLDHWFQRYPASLRDFQNGDIGYYQASQFYILDNQTLKIKQNLPQKDIIDDVRCLFTYKDPQTKKSTFLVGRLGNSIIVSQLQKLDNGTYVPEERFNTYDASSEKFVLTITSNDSATRVAYCSVQYWSNFKSIVDVSYDIKYYLKARNKVAISHNEKIFVVKNDSGFYQFWDLYQDYDIKLNKAVFVSYNDLRVAKMTSDDKFLFVAMSNPRNKHDIAKIDIEAGQFQFIIDSDGSSDNIFDFAIFHTQYNRIVTLQQKNNTNYFLQLRALDTLKVIYEFPLKFGFPILEYKLVGNIQWGLAFALGLRIKNSYYDLQNDTKLYLFKIQNDQIKNLNITQDATFGFIQSTDDYILTHKIRFPLIRAYHYTNLTLKYNIKSQSQYEVGLKVQKNFILISSGNREGVIDLKQSSQRLGYFYKDQNPYFDSAIEIVFPNRGVLLVAPNSIRYPQSIKKKFYNITSPIVKYILQISDDNLWNCNSPIYYIPPQINNEKCNYVFYLKDQNVQQGTNKHKLIIFKYSQCTKKIEQYSVNNYITDKYMRSILFISSDKKYIIILIQAWQSQQYYMEIRSISSLSNILFSKLYINYIKEYYYINQLQIDFINDKTYIFHTPQSITIQTINPKQYSKQYSIEKIKLATISKAQIIALTGPLQQAQESTKIVAKKIFAKDILFQILIGSAVKMISLSEQGQFLAVFTEKSQLMIWDVQSKIILFEKKFPYIVDLQFQRSDFLMIFTDSGETKIDLTTFQVTNISSRKKAFVKILNKRQAEVFIDKTHLKITAEGNQQFTSIIFSQKKQNIYGLTTGPKIVKWSPIMVESLRFEEQKKLLVE